MRFPHIDKEDAIIAGGYVAFIAVFWLIGGGSVGKATAFFGLAALTGFYAVLVRTIKKLLAK